MNGKLKLILITVLCSRICFSFFCFFVFSARRRIHRWDRWRLPKHCQRHQKCYQDHQMDLARVCNVRSHVVLIVSRLTSDLFLILFMRAHVQCSLNSFRSLLIAQCAANPAIHVNTMYSYSVHRTWAWACMQRTAKISFIVNEFMKNQQLEKRTNERT